MVIYVNSNSEGQPNIVFDRFGGIMVYGQVHYDFDVTAGFLPSAHTQETKLYICMSSIRAVRIEGDTVIIDDNYLRFLGHSEHSALTGHIRDRNKRLHGA